MNELEKSLEQWQDTVINHLPQAFLAIIVVIAFYFIAKFTRYLSLKFYARIFKTQSDIVRIVSAFIFFFFVISGLFLALEILGLDSYLTKLIAGAGIIGVVAGFAFKDIVSNIFAGFLLHMQRPFKMNDWVEINKNFGTVHTIGWVTTSIKTLGGQEVFVPNQIIYNTVFTNYSSFDKRRVVFKSGVSYGDDLEFVKKVTLEEVRKVKALLKDESIDFYFTSIGSSAYNFEVRFWINFKNENDYLEAMNETIILIKKRFAQENISIAYSVMTLDFGVKGGVNLFDNPLNIQSSNRNS